MAGLITTLTPKCFLFLIDHICISDKENMRIIMYNLKNILRGLDTLFLDVRKFFMKGFIQLFKS